jgi:hypothetical protein
MSENENFLETKFHKIIGKKCVNFCFFSKAFLFWLLPYTSVYRISVPFFVFFFCYIYGFLSEVAIPRHKFRQHHSPPGKTTLKPKTTHKRKKIKNFVNPAETFVKALAKTRYEYDF